jgi:hypothetical protein
LCVEGRSAAVSGTHTLVTEPLLDVETIRLTAGIALTDRGQVIPPSAYPAWTRAPAVTLLAIAGCAVDLPLSAEPERVCSDGLINARGVGDGFGLWDRTVEGKDCDVVATQPHIRRDDDLSDRVKSVIAVFNVRLRCDQE